MEGCSLLSFDLLLIIGIDDKRQERTVNAGRRLDNIGNILLAAFSLAVDAFFAAAFGMLSQVEIAPVSDALQFRPAHREKILDVIAVLGIVGKIVLAVMAQAKVFLLDTQFGIPLQPLLDQVIKPLLIGSGLNEVLHLHVLKFPGPEDEVAGGDFIAEGLAYLADAQRQLFTGSSDHVLKVNKYALGSLGPEIDNACTFLYRTHKGLEHQVEHARLGQPAPTLGTLLALHCISTPPQVAGLALHQGIREIINVAAGGPYS